MAEPTASTAFLADNDHDHGYNYSEEDDNLPKNAPANAHFKRPIKILTAITSLFSFLVFGLLIGAYVFLKTGPFTQTNDPERAARDLAIVLFVNLILSTPSIFFMIPILITTAINIAFSITVLVFSAHIFSDGWPDSWVCQRWDYTPGRYHTLPETLQCKNARTQMRIILGVAGGCGILIGILILATLFLRIIAIVKTRFWENHAKAFGGFGWKPKGFTIQFSLSILPHDDTRKAVTGAGERAGEGRLIETDV